MTISVIIVSWNAKTFLVQCIQSVLQQCSTHPIEVIVVDNASSDGSPEAVRNSFPTVKLICNQDNYGFAKGNNIGIKVSEGEYLLLINSDVVVRENCFNKMIEYAEGHPEIGMLGPRIVDSNGRTQRSCMGYPSLWNILSRALALDSLFPKSKIFGGQLLTFWGHDEIRSVNVINGCFWMLRKSALTQVGLLDERFFIYGEDIDWCRRFNQSGWDVVFFPHAEATHYGGASSANAPIKFYLEMQRANYQYWIKHHTCLASKVFLLINLVHHSVRIVCEIVRFLLVRTNRIESTHKIKRCLASINWSFSQLLQ